MGSRCGGLLILALVVGACGRSPVMPHDPSLDASSDLLRFSAEVGSVPSAQTLSVVDVNGLSLKWRAVVSAPWVQVVPSSAVTPTQIQVTVSTRGLRTGATHRAGISIVLEDGGVAAAGTSFVVELTLDAPGWQALDGPGCGFATAVAVNPDDPNVIVAGLEYGGLGITSDGGASFYTEQNSDNPMADVVLLPGGRGYAAARGLYRTDDGGLSWSLVGLANIFLQWLAVDPTDDDVLLAEGAGLWRSVDGGVTWEQIATPLSSNSLIADPWVPGRFLIGGDGGSVFTTNGSPGTDLAAVSATGFNDDVVGLAVLSSGRWVASHDADSDRSPNIRVSDDQGATWQNPGGAGLPSQEQGVHFWIRAIGDTLYGLHKNLYRSVDGGVTFELIDFPLRNYRGNDRRFYGLAIWNDELLLAHHSLGLVRLGAGSATPMPLYSCAVKGLSIDAVGDLYGALNPGGVFARRSGVFEGLSGNGGPSARRYRDLSLDPRSSASMIVGTENYRAYVTTDAGNTWQSGPAGHSGEDVHELDRVPGSPDVIWYAAYGGGVLRSVDNGLSVVVLATGYVNLIGAISATEAIYSHAGLIKKVDEAGTITTVADPPDSINYVGSSADGSVWFAAHDGLRRSTDGAQTFSNLGLESTTIYGVVVVPAAPDHIFVATSRGLFESIDGGATWAEAGSAFTPTSLAWDDIGGLLYVGTSGGGTYTYQPQ